MNIDFFVYVKNRMPHFFNNVSVAEIGPFQNSKKIFFLYENSKYSVFKNSLIIPSNSFNVSLSINCFQYDHNFWESFAELHRISKKFVMFGCAAAGNQKTITGGHNLTKSDFENNPSFDTMFESYRFAFNSQSSELFFWGVKK